MRALVPVTDPAPDSEPDTSPHGVPDATPDCEPNIDTAPDTQAQSLPETDTCADFRPNAIGRWQSESEPKSEPRAESEPKSDRERGELCFERYWGKRV